jgi:aspartate kinase
MKEVSRLVTADGKEKLVVLSAMSGTTNSLVEISDYLYKNNIEGAVHVIAQLEQKYMAHVEELYKSEKYKTETRTFLKSVFDGLRAMAKVHFTSFEEKIVLAQGELMSTNMVTNYLLESGIKAILLPALEMVRTDKNAEPDTAFIREKSRRMMEENKGYQIYITQGFICRNAYGDIDNLLRGGSDYTACLLGAALEADEIQIWTDIDGMHNNDPRIVEGTVPVRQLNFDEAAELAYFGAKILHPTCIQPAKFAGVPVRLLNTMDPTAPGTIINNDFIPGKIKAVAARDGNVCIQITSSRMLLAYGFLRKVFEIFEQHKTSIDMICTSEVGVSVTVDNLTHLDDIVGELKKYGTVQVDRDMTIICVVGDLRQENKGFETLACEALREIPVRMISYGGSNHNISFLIHKDDKKATLQALSKVLF